MVSPAKPNSKITEKLAREVLRKLRLVSQSHQISLWYPLLYGMSALKEALLKLTILLLTAISMMCANDRPSKRTGKKTGKSYAEKSSRM